MSECKYDVRWSQDLRDPPDRIDFSGIKPHMAFLALLLAG